MRRSARAVRADDQNASSVIVQFLSTTDRSAHSQVCHGCCDPIRARVQKRANETGSWRTPMRCAGLKQPNAAPCSICARGVIGDDAFHEVEEQLDRAELHGESLPRGR
jgi:hypothetical protein